MNSTSLAIVLYMQKYSDRASIVHAYTREGGRETFIVYGKRFGKNNLSAILRPLSLVEIETSKPRLNQLPIINKANLHFIPKHLFADSPIYQTIVIFISEVLSRTLTHPLAEPQLFDYLAGFIERLDTTEKIQNIHLQFLLHLSTYLGIVPDISNDGQLLDLRSAELVATYPLHNDFLTEEETSILKQLDTTTDIDINRALRQSLLIKLCRYYEIHIPSFQTPKSLQILFECFD